VSTEPYGQRTSPSGEYRLDLEPDEIIDAERDPNPNRREHPVILYRRGREVARVFAYQPEGDLSAVTDSGIFMVGDWGPENKDLYGIVSVFDDKGQTLFERRFKANLGGVVLSLDGKLVFVETLVSKHEDGDSLFLIEVPTARVLWRQDRPVSPRRWAIENEQIWAIFDDLGRFAINLDGVFVDRDKFEHACVVSGGFDHYEPVVRSWLQDDNLDAKRTELALEHADRLVSAGFASYAPNASRVKAKVLRIKGELLDAKGDAPGAARWYRSSLASDPKVGVKRRLAALEKVLPAETVESLRREVPLDEEKKEPSKTKRAVKSAPLRLVAFDLETTGLDADTCEVIEIAGVKFLLDGRIEDTFQTFAKPDHPIPPAVVKKTGITDAMVKNARPPWFAFRDFAAWVGNDATLVAHNAPFDCKFLQAAYARASTPLPRWNFVDTLAWARSSRLDVPNYRLETLLVHIGANTTGLHRALADAKGAALLAIGLASQLKNPSAGFTRRAKTLSEAAFDPATSRQISYLRDLGAPEKELTGIEKDRASQLIDYYKSLQAKRPRASRSGCVVLVLVVLVGAISTLYLAVSL
jgi:DNA polymerase III epsilon subunit family exonuclease